MLQSSCWDCPYIVQQVEYKKDLENTKGHSINFCETPQFQNAAKVAKFTSDVSVTTSKIFYMHKRLYKTQKDRYKTRKGIICVI